MMTTQNMAAMVLNFEQRLLRDDSARVHCLAHSCDRDVGNMTRRAARELANSSTHEIDPHCIVWKLGVFLRLVEGEGDPRVPSPELRAGDAQLWERLSNLSARSSS